MSEQFTSSRKKTSNILLYITAFLAVAVINIVTQSTIDKQPIPWYVSALLAISIALIAIHWYETRIKIPKKIEKKVDQAKAGWWVSPQFDLPPIFVVLIATLPQSAAVILDSIYGYFVPLITGITLYLLYRKYREKIPSFGMALSLMFVTSLLAVPPAFLVLKQPSLLQEFGLDIYNSRRLAFLLFPSSQLLLGYTTLALSSYAWRNRTLINKGLDQKSFHDLQKRAMISATEAGYNGRLLDFLDDFSYVTTLFREGNFGLVISWGWRIFDRALPILSKSCKRQSLDEKTPVKRQAELYNFRNDDFDECYDIRRKTVHAGHKPNWKESLLLITELARLLRHIIEDDYKRENGNLAL